MNKIITTTLLVVILFPINTCAEASCYSTQSPIIAKQNVVIETQRHSVNAVQISACKNGQAESIVNHILIPDAKLNRMIIQGFFGTAATLTTIFITTELINYIKNSEVRKTKRAIAVARLKAELAQLQPSAVVAA